METLHWLFELKLHFSRIEIYLSASARAVILLLVNFAGCIPPYGSSARLTSEIQ